MERTARGLESGERAQRELLEQLQVELRQARRSLEQVQATTFQGELKLREALGEAMRSTDAASARLKALEQERDTLRAVLSELDERLAAKRAEQRVLAAGAAAVRKEAATRAREIAKAKLPDGEEGGINFTSADLWMLFWMVFAFAGVLFVVIRVASH